LLDFIDRERKRGNANINTYLVVLYKKYSIPVSAFILTIIAVAVSSMKRRGGMGMNLAIGILLAFSFVFFDKIFGVMAEKSAIPPIIAVWIPNTVLASWPFTCSEMQSDNNLKSYLNLPPDCFYLGFTAVLVNLSAFAMLRSFGTACCLRVFSYWVIS
jgi:ABC-type transport system involved in multi-copper enzyme maturation permease subunit